MANWTDAVNSLQTLLKTKLTTPPTLRIFSGWPEPNALLRDLRTRPLDSVAHISIYPYGKSERTTRYISVNPQATFLPVTEVVTVENNIVTFEGSATEGDNIFILLNGEIFGVPMSAGLTGDEIALAFTALINASGLNVLAEAQGQSVVVNGVVWVLAVKAVGQAQTCVETARINRPVMIGIWAPSNALRARLSEDLIQIVSTQEFLTFPDGSQGRILFEGDLISDAAMPSGIMRQDVFASIEYAMFALKTVPRVAVIKDTLILMIANGGSGTVTQTIFSVDQISSLTAPTTTPTPGGEMHYHIHEIPTGTRPGVQFTLSTVPVVHSEEIYLNSLRQQRVLSTPGVGEYTINLNIVTLGFTVRTEDWLFVDYEVQT